MSGPRRGLAGAAWVGALVATIAGLHHLGSGPLSAPPLLDPSELHRWLDGRGPVVAAFALVRLVALALAGYLLVVTVLGLAARLSRVPGLVAAVDLATVPAARRVLGVVAGVGLTASVAGAVGGHVPSRSPVPSEAVASADAPVVLRRIPDRSDVILRRLPGGGEVGTGETGWAGLGLSVTGPPPATEEEGVATMRVDEGEPATDGEPGGEGWVVAPGQHLWSIAEAALARAWGRPPSDAEVAPHWEAVVEVNRARLVDPGNPDLIRPGQVLILPSPPPDPSPRGR